LVSLLSNNELLIVEGNAGEVVLAGTREVSTGCAWNAVKGSARWIAGVLTVVMVLGLIIVLIHFSTNVNVRIILDDVAESGRLPEYAGWYSAFGVIALWSSAVFVFVASRYGAFQSGSRRRFLVTYALIIGLLALDALLLFHEWIGLKLVHMTETDKNAATRSRLESIVFAVYVLIAVVWAWWSREQILKSPWPLLTLGILRFGASISLDLLPYLVDVRSIVVETTLAVLEELLKLVGIGGLAVYGYLLAVPHLRPRYSASAGEFASKRSGGGL
jgi:hypothetical protein